MKRYLQMYSKLMLLNFHALLAYRANFFNSVFSSTLWCLFILLSMFLITRNVKSFYGWSREEILLLSGSFNIIIGVFHLLFSRNFERFSQLIHFGQLDNILLKPLDTQFLLSCWLVGYSSIARILIGVLFNIYILNQMKVVVTPIGVIGFIVLMTVSIVLIYSIWFITATLIIWFTRLSNLINLLFSVNGIGRYPKEMYQEVNYFLYLFVLPLTFTLITPTKVLINKVLIGDIFGLVFFAVVLFIISRIFWKFALRSYTSASG